MKRLTVIAVIAFSLLTSCKKIEFTNFKSDWDKSPDGTWVGPDCWANRLQDWHIADRHLECLSTKPMRTVHLMTRQISDRRGILNSSVYISVAGENDDSGDAAAGILVGAGKDIDYRSASLVFHSWGKGAGIFIGLDSKGNLFIRDFEREDYFFKYEKKNNIQWTDARLVLNILPKKGTYTIKVLALDPVTNVIIDRTVASGIPSTRIQGNIALVSHAGYKSRNTRFAFTGWSVSGSKVEKNTSWNTGPLVTAQYTLSRNILKLTAQLMPVATGDSNDVILQLKENNKWVDADTSQVFRPSYTAQFRINNWDRDINTDYRVCYKISRHSVKTYYLNGTIKHDPVDKDQIKMLSLSCIKQITRPEEGRWSGIDGGEFPFETAVTYPHITLVNNLKKFNPDIVFFAGDQVYEGSSPTAADLDHPYLDYLYKWYLWCITYRDLTTSVPVITIPDDHDVYHGNLWGAGGIATPPGLKGTEAQDAGGYKMPAEFVNMVQTTQTSHLPDPADPAPVGEGITVYFTECNIGGVSIAVIEDRKFKSAPKSLFPRADIVNGWPHNRNWNVRYNSRIGNAYLLGNRQIKFLEEWSGDWSRQTWMKAVVSQTLFANLATIPRDSLDDDAVPLMEIPDSGSYVEGDRLATDFDSDGWPQNGRDRALRIFRKAFAIHIAGDQHLGSTVQYGIDQFRDAGFAIVSPATGNLWPRHWFPPYNGTNRKPEWPGNYGDFEDGFGNKMTVFAVANPHKINIKPVLQNELSTGFSTIIFNRQTRDIELSNWPYYADPEKDKPFPFWPVRINQLDNYNRTPVGWLPEIRVEGMVNPVIKIIRETTGEIIYSLRIKGNTFQPRVFETGYYTIEIGEPDQNKWQKIEKVYPTTFIERQPLDISF